MSCFFIPKLTFTLCLKTRQSICCLWGSKVSSIQLIIYMTFRKSGSDLLSSFYPLCSLSPVPSQTVNGEFITSSPPIIFRMKRIYISFITLYHCYCGESAGELESVAKLKSMNRLRALVRLATVRQRLLLLGFCLVLTEVTINWEPLVWHRIPVQCAHGFPERLH